MAGMRLTTNRYNVVQRAILGSLGFFFIAMPGLSQVFSFGVKGGLPLAGAYSRGSDEGLTSVAAYNRPYIIGPTAEVHFPLNLSFEVDALYRRNGFEYSFTQYFFSPLPPTYEFFVNEFSRARVYDWQLPLLAKYELRAKAARPFVDGGVVYRHVSGTTPEGLTPDHPSSVGVAAGAGLALKLGFLKISPEIRYTHWTSRPFSNSNNGVFISTTNQADLLLGFSF
jgi:hypothetical protein